MKLLVRRATRQNKKASVRKLRRLISGAGSEAEVQRSVRQEFGRSGKKCKKKKRYNKRFLSKAYNSASLLASSFNYSSYFLQNF